MISNDTFKAVLSILRGATEPKGLYEQVRAAFPHTTYVCDPTGELIYWEGDTYDAALHKMAWERSAQYIPIFKQGTLTWKPFRSRTMFFAQTPKTQRTIFPRPIAKRVKLNKNHWKGGLPPIQKGMVGTYENQRAVIVESKEKESSRKEYVGIGHEDCQFKNFGDTEPTTLGTRSTTIVTTTWFARYGNKTKKIKVNKFKRSKNVMDITDMEMASIDKFLLETPPEQVALVQDTPVEAFVETKNTILCKQLVQELCPCIVNTPATELIRSLGRALDSDTRVTQCGDEYLCTFEDDKGIVSLTLDEPPTEDYYQRLLHAPLDWNPHVVAIWDMVRRIQAVTQNTNPHRMVAGNTRTKAKNVYQNGHVEVVQETTYGAPPCKCCGKQEYHDCNTHFTCKSCAVTRPKVHQGLAYREIEDRNVDMNHQGRENNTLYSAGFSSLTQVRIAPGVSKYTKTGDYEALQRGVDALHYNREDVQRLQVSIQMEEVCQRLQLSDGIARRAHLIFCKYRKAVTTLRRLNVVVCACLYMSIDKPFVPLYKKNKPKPRHVPHLNMRQKRLKRMSFKNDYVGKRRRFSRLSKRSNI